MNIIMFKVRHQNINSNGAEWICNHYRELGTSLENNWFTIRSALKTGFSLPKVLI